MRRGTYFAFLGFFLCGAAGTIGCIVLLYALARTLSLAF